MSKFRKKSVVIEAWSTRLIDRIAQAAEENANLVLWCVHVLGPDDVYAEPSHAAAVAAAEKLNRDTRALLTEKPNDILCFAYAAPWPHSDADHARAIIEQAHQEAAFKAARAIAPE